MSKSNERLEYLGDAVISLVVADKLYELYPDEREGFLTRARAKCVCRENLNIVGEKLHLEQHLNTTNSLMQKSPNIYGNALEAIVGAIYLDKGMPQAKAFVQKYVIGDNNHLLKRLVEKELDFKSRLLEWGQSQKKRVTFEIISDAYTAATDTHTFVCCVKIDDKEVSQAAGANKQLAHQAAAKRALNAVNKMFGQEPTNNIKTQ